MQRIDYGQAWLGILVTLLVAAVVVQGVLLFQMRRETSGPAETPAPAVTHRTEARDKAESRPDAPWTGFDFPAFGHSADAWDPFEEMVRMREQMDRLFGESMNRLRMMPNGVERFGAPSFQPEMDLREEEDRYVIRFNIPGAEKTDIHVAIDDRVLTVSGMTNQHVKHEEGGRVLRTERRQGEFRRTITLPGPVKAEAMEAHYEKGVLIVTVPKAVDIPPSRRIHVT